VISQTKQSSVGSTRRTSSLNQAHGKNANDASVLFSYCVLHSLDQFDHLKVKNRCADSPRAGILLTTANLGHAVFVCTRLDIIVTKLDHQSQYGN
jgi:hypothetical protein